MVPDTLSPQLLDFCHQICAGMRYLSDKGFVHRDIAARNILVSGEVCKVWCRGGRVVYTPRVEYSALFTLQVSYIISITLLYIYNIMMIFSLFNYRSLHFYKVKILLNFLLFYRLLILGWLVTCRTVTTIPLMVVRYQSSGQHQR